MVGRRVLAAALSGSLVVAWAADRVGEGFEPQVTLKQHDNRQVEEYRYNDHLYMMRVTPAAGPSYLLVDPDGTGDLEWRRDSSGLVERAPRWTLFSW
jgi:hypothetical protein